MYYSQTPPRHADHDHAIAKLNAGGFLWVEAIDGKRRNLVGRPGKVLVLHWFDPTAEGFSEQAAAARYAKTAAADEGVEVLFIALAPSWEGLGPAADSGGSINPWWPVISVRTKPGWRITTATPTSLGLLERQRPACHVDGAL